jgi:hypothetical protein
MGAVVSATQPNRAPPARRVRGEAEKAQQVNAINK